MTKTISKKNRHKKAKWLSEESVQIAEKRREVKGKGKRERCTQLNAEFQRTARRDKKTFLFLKKINLLILIGGQFLYNTVMVFAMHQHELAVGIYVFLSEQCKEVEENNKMGKTGALFEKIRSRTFHAKMSKTRQK